jgi:hypothetical protein
MQLNNKLLENDLFLPVQVLLSYGKNSSASMQSPVTAAA